MATFTFDTTAVRDYTIVDHGGLDNAAPVTLSASDLTNLQYTTDGDVVLSQNGTGSLSSGGFAIGEHLRFATDSGSRWFTFTYDALLYNQIEITGIKGNGSNGGEEPDNGEDLILQYLDGGGNWVTIDTIIAEDDTTFNTLKTAVIALPQAAQNNSQAFRLYQENASGDSYDHYGISSIKFSETISGGSPSEDYGLITTTATATEEYQEIVFTDVAYPFGKAKISGGAQAAVSSAPPPRTVEIKTQGISTESNTSVWVGSGTAFEMSGGQELIVAPWTVASGVLRSYRTTNSFVGSGDISIRDRYQIENTTEQERVVTQISVDPEEYEVSYISVPTIKEIDEDVSFSPSYNTSSVEYFEGGTDYGSVTQSSSTNLDNGNLQEGSYGGADYGLVNVTGDDYPFLPALNLQGSAVTQYKPTFTEVGTGLFNFIGEAKSEFKPNWRGRGGIFIAGSAQDSFIRPAVVEGGSIVSFNESDNSASYRYTESSVEEFDSNDFGQITSTGSAADYGTVTEGSYASFDYGYVFNIDVVEPYGLFSLQGYAEYAYKPTFTHRGSGSISIYDHYTFTKFNPHWRGRGGFSISGGEGDVFSRPAVVEGGSLVSFNQSANSAAYSYNESSVEEFSSNDFGQITISGSSTDYGTVTEGAYAGFDYGYVINTDIVEPYGLYAFSGSATTSFKPTFTQIATGLFSISGVSKNEFKPHWRGRGGFSISGGEGDVFSRPAVVEGGSLVSFNQSANSAAYSYNESSIELFSDTDFGQITATGSTTDYGSVTEGSYAGFDYGYVFNTIDQYPLDINALFAISGVANVEYNPELKQIGDGLYKITGVAETIFKPNWIGRGSINLSGGEADSVVKVFTGTGSLFSLIDSEEKAAYSYNESSIEFFGDVDLGTITATGTTVDYGNLIDGSYGGLDYGYVVSTQDDYPFDINSLFAISGSANVEYFRNLVQIGTGLFNINGNAATIFKPNWIGRGSINLSGGERDSVVKVFTATGSLFHIGEKIERATFSYNGSSIDYFNDLDRGSITNSGSQEDNGSVAEDSYAGFDYGTVINTSDTYPFGSITISGGPQGGASDSAELKVVVGGNLFGFGGAAEAVSWQTPENTALYSFNGGYSNLKASVSEVGSGSLFNYKGQFAPTDFTFRPHWRGRGVIRLFGEEGYIRLREYVSRQGSISVSGSATEAFVAQTPEDTVLFTYSGTRGSEKATASEVGSGSLFAIGTLIEAQTDFYTVPVSTSLFGVSGAAGVAQADNYNSRGGTLKIYTDDTAFNYRNYRPSPRYVNAEYGFIGGQLNIAGEVDEAFTQPFIGSGNATVTGIADTDRARDYVGTGSFNSFSGAAESRAIAINAETSLYRAFGSGDDSVTKINIGSGSLFTAGGAAESRTFAKSVTGLFSIAGDQTDTRYVPNFNGSGTLSVTNSADDAFSRILIGTGRISTFSGAAEAFVAQTPENTALYSFNGTATESFSKGNYDGIGSVFTSGFSTEKQTDAYAGTGSLFAAGGAAESRTIIAEDNTVLFTIKLNTEYVFIRGPYPGRGSLFAAGGAAEAFVAQTPENTALYSFFGNRLSEKRTSSEVGSGSLFTAGSGAESRVISQVAKTDLFALTGSAEESFSPSPYKGTGSLFASSGAAESRTIIAEDNTVLYTFSGTRLSEKATVREIGSGSLFSTGGITESRTIARSQTGLFNITGESTQIFIRGAYPSSGSLFAAGGAAEAFSAQTPENTVLYTFFGNRLNESKTTRLQGSGSLFTFGGSVERSAVAEESTGLFSISGTSEFNFTRGAYPSSGSLFATGGAAESRTIIAEDNTILFTASGTADEKFTRSSTTESAQYSFSGELAESKTSSEVGSGSLFSAGGAAEVAAVSPESTGLFNINGSTDDAFARTVIGSGSLFSVGSADEAKTTFVPIDPGFYRLVGSADESFTPAPHIGSGSATLSGTTSPEIRTLAKHGSGSATISGTAEPVIRTHAFQGSGTITLSGQTEFKLKYQTDATTILFTYQGGEGDAFTRIARTNTVEIRIDGESENRSILFTPPRIFGTII